MTLSVVDVVALMPSAEEEEEAEDMSSTEGDPNLIKLHT